MPHVIDNNDYENLRDPEWRERHKHELGRRLMSKVIDDRARQGYKTPYASIPKTLNPADGFRDVSYQEFARAINRCAWWIKGQFGVSDRFETVLYVGVQDLRYPIFVMAAAKTGHVPFLVSPRNSLEAQVKLVDDAQATKVVISAHPMIQGLIEPVRKVRSLEKFVIPEVDFFLEDTLVDHIDFPHTFEDYRSKPWVKLHTSGSTGLPKIITIPHGYPTSCEGLWISPNGNFLFERFGQGRFFLSFPAFHTAGLQGCLTFNIFFDGTVVMPPPVPLTPDLVNSVHLHGRVDMSCLPSALIMGLAKNKDHLKNLKQIKGVWYGGGPLAKEVGDELVKHVHLNSQYGSTETLGVALLDKPAEYWQYFKFDLEWSGIDMRKVPHTELYECVWVKNPKLSLAQPVFTVFPDLDEYRTNDLFSKHPSRHDLWRFEGRLDDVIVFSTGEKVNPVDMEGTISSCPQVTGALVVGQSRFQTALFVEVKTPPTSEQEKDQLLDSIWPFVEMANQRAPHYAKISRALTAVINPEKQFPRAGKGTIIRQQSVVMLEKEAEELYAAYDTTNSSPASAKDLKDLDAIIKFLHEWLLRESRIEDLTPQTDLFAAGMDSLEAAKLVRLINGALSGQEILPKQVYDNPTIEMLAASLTKPPAYLDHGDDSVTWGRMQKVFDEAKSTFSGLRSEGNVSSQQINGNNAGTHVILTGSTGSLGSYLLDQLLANKDVTKVTCLNRTHDASTRQVAYHETRGLTTDLASPRVEFLVCNLAASSLGLELSRYQSLLQSATHIIHNAWTVDFNRHFTSFEPQIEGVKRLIEFACTSSQSARFFYMSSISVAGHWRTMSNIASQVPEVVLEDWKLAKMGYGQSKLVAERLIAEAVRQCGMNGAICRLGQIGGPVLHGEMGEWNQAEWVPSLVVSSKNMGMIPRTLGPLNAVDWLPVDLVAQSCLELLFNEDAVGKELVRVWHVANPQTISWSSLVPAFIQSMGGEVRSVTVEEWLEALEDRSRQEDSDIQKLPATKLIPFFHGLKGAVQASDGPKAILNMSSTIRHSETMMKVSPVRSDWVDLWVKQWKI